MDHETSSMCDMIEDIVVYESCDSNIKLLGV